MHFTLPDLLPISTKGAALDVACFTSSTPTPTRTTRASAMCYRVYGSPTSALYFKLRQTAGQHAPGNWLQIRASRTSYDVCLTERQRVNESFTDISSAASAQNNSI
jgi:hypothetical protein